MKTILMAIAIISTGLMAGIFLTWTNAVTPGIGKLNDMIYLKALQSMNRAILNPLFYVVFMLPIISMLISTAINYGSNKVCNFKLLLMATVIYTGGVFIVTIFGNIPLNELLNQTDLGSKSVVELSTLREKIEIKWNQFNLIRTITSFTSFALLVLNLLLRK